MGYKRKRKSTVDIARITARNLKLDKTLTEKVTLLYVEKIKNAVLDETKIILNGFGTFELTKWNSDGIYDIKSKTKVERSIKTILFRISPLLKKKLED